MKQSSDHVPQARPVVATANPKTTVSGIVRVILISLAWLAVVPFALEILSIVLATWR